jgi:hypothetical protein
LQEQKKRTAYTIPPEYRDEVLERVVDGLRAERRAEEARILEEQRIQERKQKILERKAGKQGTAEILSYDIDGNPIGLKNIPALPDLLSRCVQAPPQPPETAQPTNSPRHSPRNSPRHTLRPHLRPNPLNEEEQTWETKLMQTEKTKGKNKVSGVLKGLYERLVPAAGVTFAERGKDPKSSQVSIGQEVGQWSKTDFNTLGTEQARDRLHSHTATLPYIQKPRSQAPGATQCKFPP